MHWKTKLTVWDLLQDGVTGIALFYRYFDSSNGSSFLEQSLAVKAIKTGGDSVKCEKG